MKTSSCTRVEPLLAALAFALALSGSARADDHSRTVGGYTVYLGIVPAEVVKGHKPGHPERQMHGGLPYRRGQQHIMVVILETTSGNRITDARVVARVSETGLAPMQKPLEPMGIAGAMSFGNYFPMRGPGPYSIKVTFELPAVNQKLETEFRYAMPR